MRVPLPTSESIVMVPLILDMFVLTTSMPTPLPDMLLTALAVENPGMNIMLNASLLESFSASSAGISPFSTADLFKASGSMPLPSSLTETTMLRPSW